MEIQEIQATEEPKLNPYSEEKLSPKHLELLFPATFYKSDEDLSLHLTESCLIDSLAWEGDKAIGETAFWLKVLSTPQTDFLKQQKKLFKLAIAEQCSQIYRTYELPRLGIEPEVITLENKKVSAAVKIDSVPKPVTSTVVEAPRGVKQVIKFTTNESGQQVGVLETIQDESEGTIITENEWDLIEKHLNEGSTAATTANQEIDLEAESTTPGFGIKTYRCRLCDFSCDNRATLQKHQKITHPAELPYSCDRCNYTSKYAWSVKTHIDSVHLKSKRFKCPDCDYATSQACFLKRHTIRKHNPEVGAYKCSYCDYAAHHPNTLLRHVNRQHTQNFAHKCPYCDYGRDCKYLVEDHINDVHLKKVVYKCSECSFQTYKQRALKSHHKSHQTKSTMQCSECDYKSLTAAGLKRHMKNDHPDKKEAIATIVGAAESKRLMTGVMATEGDEFTAVVMGKCKYCDYANENLIKLKAHVRRVHKKFIPCKSCSFVGKNMAALNRHMVQEHPKRTRRPVGSGVPVQLAVEVSATEGVRVSDEITYQTIDGQVVEVVTPNEGLQVEGEVPSHQQVEIVKELEGVVVIQGEVEDTN